MDRLGRLQLEEEKLIKRIAASESGKEQELLKRVLLALQEDIKIFGEKGYDEYT